MEHCTVTNKFNNSSNLLHDVSLAGEL